MNFPGMLIYLVYQVLYTGQQAVIKCLMCLVDFQSHKTLPALSKSSVKESCKQLSWLTVLQGFILPAHATLCLLNDHERAPKRAVYACGQSQL